MDTTQDTPAPEPVESNRGPRYAYLRSDGTLDIILGSLVAGIGAYIYQFLGGRSLGAEAFAPIGALLTAHFLAFVIFLLPVEQFVIRRLTLGDSGWVVPVRAIIMVATVGIAAGAVVWTVADDYFDGDAKFIFFVFATVAFHFYFAVGRGYLAGYRRFRAYGLVSGAASMFRLVIAIGVVVVAPSVAGFAWAQVLGPLVIVFWRPFREPKERREGSRGGLAEHHVESIDDKGLLSGLVLSSAASQALLLAGPLVAGALGATDVEFSILYATLLLARAPLTFGYNLIARVLPPFTEMAARGERRELRAWARGMAIASAFLAFIGAGLGALLGPVLVSVAFGSDFRPPVEIAALAAAGVVLAGGGLFIGQILVARGQPLRLAIVWMFALVASTAVVMMPFEDPIMDVTVAFLVGEIVAMIALVLGALMHDRQEVEVSHGYIVVKRSMDIGISLVALILLSPVLVIAAIAVRLDSEGPAFFRQQRVGRGGRNFWMTKIRTMVIHHQEEVFHEHLERIQDADADDDVYTIKIDDDPRVTKVGAVLRRLSIDELPNLWNVLKGSMTLVGPRPLVRAEAELIGLDNPRFSVKPGVTGLAQVKGRDNISIEARTAYDEEYVANRSVRLDVDILFSTVGAVFRNPGEHSEG